MNYSDKLKSPKWQKKRLEVLSRDSFTCKCCGDQETELHVHHLKYTKEPYDAPLIDLQTLCKHCHYYYTFNHNDILKSYDLYDFDFIKIHKFKNLLVAEYKYTIFIFYIDKEKLEFAIPFYKGSIVLNKIFEISNNI